MKNDNTSFIESYISKAPLERQVVLANIRNILHEVLLPMGFEECESYGMIGYVVPFSRYPAGYHCDPKLPLPFVSIANQKHGIHLYHMGIYTDVNLLTWWQTAYAKRNIGKLDMGKSCIRWKNMEKIPYDLIRELMEKMTMTRWIEFYEKNIKLY